MGCNIVKNKKNIDSPHKKISPEKNEETLKGIILSDLDIEATELLVSGGFGDVVKIPLKLKKEILAVKILSVSSLNQDELNEMKKEMMLLEKISYQPIKPRCFPEYFGYFVEVKRGNNLVYNICFKYHPNTLRSYIKELQDSKITIDPTKLLHLSDTLINGLAFLQLLGICHRDIKPENILLDEFKENLIIIDFGAAKNILEQSLKSSQTKMNVTIIGTKPYASPEMLQGLTRDENETQTGLAFSAGGTSILQINPYKSDVFSFGLIIMELWKEKRIKNRHSQKEYDNMIEDLQKEVQQIQNDDIIKKRLEKLIKILNKSLKIDPNERWDFIKIFKENLNLNDPKKMKLHLTIKNCLNVNKVEEFFRNCIKLYFFIN